LSHVTDGKTTEGRIVSKGLNAHWLGGDQVDDGGISRLDVLGLLLKLLSGTTIDLGLELRELAGNVGGMAIEDWGVSSIDLARMVEDDNLSSEIIYFMRGIVLDVSSDHTSLDVLDGNVLNVEADVVSGDGFGEGSVMHFNGFHFSGNVGGGKKKTVIPGLRTPVSTLPTGTVPIPEIL